MLDMSNCGRAGPKRSDRIKKLIPSQEPLQNEQ